MALRPAAIFALFAGLLGFAVAGFAPQIFHDGDTCVAPWRAGNWMLDHQAALKSDVSFLHPGRAGSWDAQEWLSEILMALSFQAPGVFGGWNGMHLLFGRRPPAPWRLSLLIMCGHAPAPCRSRC